MLEQKLNRSLWASLLLSLGGFDFAAANSINLQVGKDAPYVVAQSSSGTSQSESDSLFSIGSGGLFDKSESSSSGATDKPIALPPASSESAPAASTVSAPSSTFATTVSELAAPSSSAATSTSPASVVASPGGNEPASTSNFSTETSTGYNGTAPTNAVAPTKSSDLTPLLPQQFNAYQLLERAEPIQQQSIRTNGDLSGFDLNAQTAPRAGATSPGVNTDSQADQTGAQAINSFNQLLSTPGSPPGEAASNGERTSFKLPASPEETASGTLRKEPVEEPGKVMPEDDVQAIVGKEQMHESAGSHARATGLPPDQNKNSPIEEALSAMHSGQYLAAADKLNAIVAKNHSDAQAHYLLAVSYVFLNRVSDASYEYQSARKYAPPGSGLKERVDEGLKRLGALNNLK
jgi:hypothetical protein